MTFLEPFAEVVRNPCTDGFVETFPSDTEECHNRIVIKTSTPETYCKLMDLLIEYTELTGLPHNIVHTGMGDDDNAFYKLNANEHNGCCTYTTVSSCFGREHLFSGYESDWRDIAEMYKYEPIVQSIFEGYADESFEPPIETAKYMMAEFMSFEDVQTLCPQFADCHNAVTVKMRVSRSLAERIAATQLCVYDFRVMDMTNDIQRGARYICPVQTEEASKKHSRNTNLASIFCLSSYECERNYFAAKCNYSHEESMNLLNGYACAEGIFTATVSNWQSILDALHCTESHEAACLYKTLQLIVDANKTPVKSNLSKIKALREDD